MNTLAEGKQKKRKKGSRTKLVTLIFWSFFRLPYSMQCNDWQYSCMDYFPCPSHPHLLRPHFQFLCSWVLMLIVQAYGGHELSCTLVIQYVICHWFFINSDAAQRCSLTQSNYFNYFCKHWYLHLL
jgi:hypothetical protein